MKKMIPAIIAFTFVFGAMFAFIILGKYSDSHYTTTAKVYEQNGNDLILVDNAGLLWAIEKRPDLAVNDFITIYFYNNNTHYTRKDDIIIKIKKLDI